MRYYIFFKEVEVSNIKLFRYNVFGYTKFFYNTFKFFITLNNNIDLITKSLNDNIKWDIDFLNNCKQVAVYLKFLFFKLPKVSNKDTSSICKRVLRSSINKRNKELQHVLKKLSISEDFLTKHLSTIDFYILTKSIISHSDELLKK